MTIHLYLAPSLDSPCPYGGGAGKRERLTHGHLIRSREPEIWPMTGPG